MPTVRRASGRSLRRQGLIALLALALQWVALGISGFHAAALLAAPGAMQEVCTPAGIVRIGPDGSGHPAGPSAGPACPFCASATAAPPLPPAVRTPLVGLPPAARAPSSEEPDVRVASLDRRHAPTRAPPSLFA